MFPPRGLHARTGLLCDRPELRKAVPGAGCHPLQPRALLPVFRRRQQVRDGVQTCTHCQPSRSPLVSLTELTTPYDERFAQLLQKTVVQTIEEVRAELYGRAVRRLQRVFRKSRRNLNINLDSESSASPQTKMPTLSKRRLSIAAARNPPALVKIEDAADESAALEEEHVPSKTVAVDDNQVVGKSEDSALEIAERRHEDFLAKKQAALEEMAQLLTNPQYRGRETPSPPNVRLKAGTQMRSGLLSPKRTAWMCAGSSQWRLIVRYIGVACYCVVTCWSNLLFLLSSLVMFRRRCRGLSFGRSYSPLHLTSSRLDKLCTQVSREFEAACHW